jgi:hypothetical protein
MTRTLSLSIPMIALGAAGAFALATLFHRRAASAATVRGHDAQRIRARARGDGDRATPRAELARSPARVGGPMASSACSPPARSGVRSRPTGTERASRRSRARRVRRRRAAPRRNLCPRGASAAGRQHHHPRRPRRRCAISRPPARAATTSGSRRWPGARGHDGGRRAVELPLDVVQVPQVMGTSSAASRIASRSCAVYRRRFRGSSASLVIIILAETRAHPQIVRSSCLDLRGRCSATACSNERTTAKPAIFKPRRVQSPTSRAMLIAIAWRTGRRVRARCRAVEHVRRGGIWYGVERRRAASR